MIFVDGAEWLATTFAQRLNDSILVYQIVMIAKQLLINKIHHQSGVVAILLHQLKVHHRRTNKRRLYLLIKTYVVVESLAHQLGQLIGSLIGEQFSLVGITRSFQRDSHYASFQPLDTRTILAQPHHIAKRLVIVVVLEVRLHSLYHRLDNLRGCKLTIILVL